MSILITGVAGFIGSNLAKFFLSKGEFVYGIDNLSLGTRDNLKEIISHEKFSLFILDISKLNELDDCIAEISDISKISIVWHMAANSDIPSGVKNPSIDFKDTFLTTFTLLEVMKKYRIKQLAFASSSAIYGDIGGDIEEISGPLFPISNYGAMKLSSESIIGPALESWLESSWVFRFPNVVGSPATHGVIFDFINKLKKDEKLLNVLGNGTQKKSYLYIDELIDAMIFIVNNANDKCNYFNIGPEDDGIYVREIAQMTVKAVAPNALIKYGSSNKGWVGDVPQFSYNTSKLKNLGWVSTMRSDQAVEMAINKIKSQLC
jgi:UDP-glucose 4-epimerase